jgi:hypothetical protein
MGKSISPALKSLLGYLGKFCQIYRILGKVFTCTFILTLIVISVYSQVDRREVQQTQTYRLSIEQSRRQFHKGEHYKFRITLTNDTDQVMLIVTGHRTDDLSVDLRDQKNRVVPLSKEAQDLNVLPRTGSYQTIRLNPGETHIFELDLSYLYNLAVGKYKLFISIPVYGEDKVLAYSARLKPTEISIR